MGFEQEALDRLFASIDGTKSAMRDQFMRASKGEPVVLRHLRMDGPSTPSQLAMVMRASSGRVSAVLSALEKKGLVTREIDMADRRNIIVRLTETGMAQAERDQAEMRDALCWIFAQMGERRAREFVDLVSEFVTYMSICEPGRPRPTAEQVAQAFERRRELAESAVSAAAQPDSRRA